jgi:hypothetical protein
VDRIGRGWIKAIGGAKCTFASDQDDAERSTRQYFLGGDQARSFCHHVEPGGSVATADMVNNSLCAQISGQLKQPYTQRCNADPAKREHTYQQCFLTM